MGFEAPDIDLFLRLRSESFAPNESCAILGDCHFYYGDNIEQFKKRCGFSTVETFDINGDPTHRLDLQEPIAKEFHGKYDWIVDAGTLYCCFDISTVLENMMLMLKDNGTVFHMSNLVGHFGRGFYAFSPSFFNEFYEANGFQSRRCFYRTKTSGGGWEQVPVDHNYLSFASRNELAFQDTSCVYKDMVPCESLIGYVAKRERRKEFIKPVPEHYNKSNGK
jgi:hypothetical protein